MGVIADTLAPKIVIYNKNKDVCKKNELKSLKIDQFMDIKKRSENVEKKFREKEILKL